MGKEMDVRKIIFVITAIQSLAAASSAALAETMDTAPGAPSAALLATMTPASVPHPFKDVPVAPAEAPPATQSAYVMTAFTNASQSAMNVYDSADGAHFFMRKAPAYSPPKGDLIRDPSVMKHTDGWYYVTYTTGWSGQTIGLARSRDLLDWRFVCNIDVPVPGVTQVWAPEWFIDSDGTVNIILTIGKSGPQGTFEPYRITATDAGLGAWTAPKPLGIGPNYIDSFVVKVGATYHSFIKNETTKFIEHATATSLDGPWTMVGVGDWAGWGQFFEGPALTRLPDGGWRIYFDAYMVKQNWYSDSHDGFRTWSPKTELVGSGTLRHFTVLNQRVGPAPSVVP